MKYRSDEIESQFFPSNDGMTFAGRIVTRVQQNFLNIYCTSGKWTIIRGYFLFLYLTAIYFFFSFFFIIRLTDFFFLIKLEPEKKKSTITKQLGSIGLNHEFHYWRFYIWSIHDFSPLTVYLHKPCRWFNVHNCFYKMISVSKNGRNVKKLTFIWWFLSVTK